MSCMRKTHCIITILFVLACFSYVKEVSASIVTVGKRGEVTVNVLSAEDTDSRVQQTESLKIAKSSIEMGEADVPISLFRKDNKYLLNIAGKDGEKSYDVTDYKDRILEIEERPMTKKISISLSGNQFVIEQAGIKASTYYQINVEPQKSRITILTPSGYKFLSMLPREAVDVLLRSKTISSIDREKPNNISEDAKGNLYYEINGVKQVGIKDLYMYDVPVSAKISAVNGDVLELNQPIWLKILSLFEVQT
jgi:hypothetical protein